MIKSLFGDLVVVKRSGQRVSFNDTKIAIAIKKGFDSVYEEYEKKNVNKVKENVIKEIETKYKSRKTIGVEDIQDIIELELQKAKFNDVYNSYKNYRERRSLSREAFAMKQQHKFLKAIESLGLNDSKRDNIDADNDSPMRMMFHFGSSVSKEFAKAYLLDSKYTKAHDEGTIYIHNLDFFAMGTTNSIQIDLDKLFKDGFSTGYAHIRTPNDIMSYTALALIAIQSCGNDQHGEQSIPCFDYYMAPGVVKTFRKNLKNIIIDFLDIDGFSEYINIKKIKDITSRLDSIVVNLAIFKEFYDKSDRVRTIIEKAYDKALKKTEGAVFQAMEAFIHDLNSMHSSLGAVAPMSTINFGTDTSEEGRMVTKNYLLALDAGLGMGETPLYPVSIFKVENQVNFDKTDTNYDLFKLACKVSLKRLMPNFSFMNSSYNSPFKDNIKTEVAYTASRIRAIENIVDLERIVIPGRGNLSIVTINLPRIAIKCGISSEERTKKNMKEFYSELNEVMELCKGQLLQRFELQCSKKKYNFKFLLGNNVWIDSEKLDESSKLRKVLRHGTLSIGFVGLAETLKALTGKHHAESEESQKLGFEIIKFMRNKCDEFRNEEKLNFTLLATSSKEVSEKFIALDKSIYGVIKGITDKEYYTDSFHTPASYKISIAKKIEIEGIYHKYTNGGHVTYISSLKTMDEDELEKIIALMKKHDIGYAAINNGLDRDPTCSYIGFIESKCPKCGRSDDEEAFERIRRVDDYLVDISKNIKNERVT